MLGLLGVAYQSSLGYVARLKCLYESWGPCCMLMTLEFCGLVYKVLAEPNASQ